MKKFSTIIIFDHQLALRSYHETGIIKNLDQHFEVDTLYITTKSPLPVEQLKNGFRELRLRRVQTFALSVYNHIYWWKISNKALSVENRTLFNTDRSFSTLFILIITRLLAKILTTPPIRFTNFVLRSVLNDIHTACIEKEVDSIIYVTVGGSSTISDSLVAYFKKLCMPIGVVVENWDNVSSKAVLNQTPKKLGVWGKQSAKFAKEIHSIPAESIYEIGNPRIDWLLNKCGNEKNRDTIFFAGGSVSFQQELPYILAAKTFAESQRMRFAYLPHPKLYTEAYQAVKRGQIDACNLIGISEEEYASGRNLPRLSDYIYEFSRSKIVISSLSTMNLEASVLGIPSIGIDLFTSICLNGSQQRITERHDHLKEFKESNCAVVVRSIGEMKSQSEAHLNFFDNPQNSQKTRKLTEYFVLANGDFISRLCQFIRDCARE